MGEAMNASSFAGYWDSSAMLSSNNILDYEYTTVDSTPWLREHIGPSIFTSTFTPLDVQTTSLLDNNVFPLDPAFNFVVSDSTNNFNSHTCGSLAEHPETPRTGASDVCFHAPLPARVDSHQCCSSCEQITTSKLHPPGSQFNLSSPSRPKRRGRPRIYPRADDKQYLPSPVYPSSSNRARASTREQNRLAAQRFRARHDGYAAGLNAQASELTMKNKALKMRMAILREEVLGLRYNLLRHVECGCGILERYVEGNLVKLVGMEREMGEEDVDGKKAGGEDREGKEDDGENIDGL
ncbi:hypothetical protein HBI56_090460 [Parastagonospora nodorum]|uniref:BZIP domain-containing protein n=1 Tax=Phaeosphaeria nodorum (strain SN15 / ATCC MYA-4574 / FGSC 10173) TaxID=321614 RepID=A0A7U2I7Y9_PHANO|nr:hypothetical protein HBH56_109020 [Parastagonospora nodorum]QRD03243.1 hypothetical protein JI435_441680 [Parastagonospora nodorum SN15]KAH3922331.1 hypothetical protein HBH54_226120 [Parastagonospora nodorum]KAH3951280.1 hypothetical protein HBH53_064760 [Parastagonospora nodorum]KAH3974433.1 hypothetical protein HBH51_093520 [Parastagonospora nodorum]